MTAQGIYVLGPLQLVYLKARVAVLILAKAWTPDHCNGFQVPLAIGLADNGKTQHPTFTLVRA